VLAFVSTFLLFDIYYYMNKLFIFTIGMMAMTLAGLYAIINILMCNKGSHGSSKKSKR
jgi:hypothetical protein